MRYSKKKRSKLHHNHYALVGGVLPLHQPHRKRVTFVAEKAEQACTFCWYQEWLLPAVIKHAPLLTYRALEYVGLVGYAFKIITSLHKLEQYISNTPYYDFQEHIYFRRRRLDRAFITFLDFGVSVAGGIGYILFKHASWSISCFIAFGIIYYMAGLYFFAKDLSRLLHFRQEYHAGLDPKQSHLKLSLKQLFCGKTPFDHIADYDKFNSLHKRPTDDHFIKISFTYLRAQLHQSSIDLLFLSIMGAAAILWLVQPPAAVVVMITLGIVWAVVRNKYEKRVEAAKTSAEDLSINRFTPLERNRKTKRLEQGYKPCFWALQERKNIQKRKIALEFKEKKILAPYTPPEPRKIVEKPKNSSASSLLLGFTNRRSISPPSASRQTSRQSSQLNLRSLVPA